MESILGWDSFKFYENLLSSFGIILLTNKQTNRCGWKHDLLGGLNCKLKYWNKCTTFLHPHKTSVKEKIPVILLSSSLICWQYSFSILGHISPPDSLSGTKTIDNVWKWPPTTWLQMWQYASCMSRESLEKEWNANAREKLKVSGKCWEWPSQRSKGVRIDDKRWKAVVWCARVWKEKEWEEIKQSDGGVINRLKYRCATTAKIDMMISFLICYSLTTRWRGRKKEVQEKSRYETIKQSQTLMCESTFWCWIMTQIMSTQTVCCRFPSPL